MYRGWTQIEYQNMHYDINPKDEGTQEDRGRDGGTNFILRIKEQETRLTLHEHDDGDDDDYDRITADICVLPTHKAHKVHVLPQKTYVFWPFVVCFPYFKSKELPDGFHINVLYRC